ncbi:MAG: ABC transporter permease [Gemmatimonadota bacterium]
MDGLIQDLRYALRQTIRTPLVSAVAVAVLALGIATNAVVLVVLDGILFRPPPGVGDADGLVEIRTVPDARPDVPWGLDYGPFLELRERTELFDAVAVAWTAPVPLGTEQGGKAVLAEFASSDYFALLDVAMARGTGFVPGDDRQRPDGPAVTVVGHGFWQAELGGSDDVVGRSVEVAGRSYTVIGVAPEGFHGATGIDDPVSLWLPAADLEAVFPAEDRWTSSGERRFGLLARLVEGVTTERAAAVASHVASGMEGTPAPTEDGPPWIEIVPYRGPGSGIMTGVGAFLLSVGGLIGGLVLFIACANVSALLLSRAVRRRKEMGVRLAMGASRSRLIRQLLTESLLLAGIAGLLGVALAFGSLEFLERALFTFPLDLTPGLRVLGPILAVVCGAGVAFGLAPALHGTRAGLSQVMKDQVAGAGPGTSRLRDGFTVAQLGLSLPLLAGAAILVGQVDAYQAQWGWGDPQGVVGLRIDVAQSGYTESESDPLLMRIRDQAAAVPGVAAAGFASGVPYMGGRYPFGARLPEAVRDPERRFPALSLVAVDPGYLEAMDVPLRRGRALRADDAPGAPRVIVVDETVARRAWPGEDPLGRTLTLVLHDEEEVEATVVGITGAVYRGGAATYMNNVVFAPRRQIPATSAPILVVRAERGPDSGVAAAVREALRDLDPDLDVNLAGLEESMGRARTQMAHVSAGAAACGLLALLLACVGLYGAIAAGVGERTREIGVRIALGADRGAVTRHFVRRGLLLGLIALAVGLPLSWASVAVVGSRVFGVGALAPEVAVGLVAVGAVMIAVAAAASWIPARTSASVDPARALRAD